MSSTRHYLRQWRENPVREILAGAVAGWAVVTFVMETDFAFEPLSAIAIVLGGVVAVLGAGILFALRPLATRPARILRQQD